MSQWIMSLYMIIKDYMVEECQCLQNLNKYFSNNLNLHSFIILSLQETI